ncbi:phosphate ABC transporter permease PstA [Alteromonas sp. 345S023]|uniref:Phosphate transport system permease protein PstA n=1 Tax=Alteromonas profundi TaxID=2696062 RepID=A0A7X5LHX3_9ALTE|nr:phosphate ABC transporter permease PstA [Alteromonas profundi]NDV89675.1 phosphate ABC transporter permease PstA [Alteromonas profundi]
MVNLIRGLFTAVQRQSLVISLSAFFTSLLLIGLVYIFILIASRGGAYFWPDPLYLVKYQHSNQSYSVFAQIHEQNEEEKIVQLRYSHANNPYGSFLMLEEQSIVSQQQVLDVAEIKLNDGRMIFAAPDFLITPQHARAALDEYSQVVGEVETISSEIERLQQDTLAVIHQSLVELNRKGVEADAPAREKLQQRFRAVLSEIRELETLRDNYQLSIRFADSRTLTLTVAQIAQINLVNQLSLTEKWQVVARNVWGFLSQSPKQANTAGGVFPALFGTVLMVFLMTIIVTPFGVLAAIYLSEYAPDNSFTTVIRISVSNMAGVPSIVYGVFGLGFFVYTLGGNIDTLLFSDHLPAPTMGAPGVFWAALTMAILTLPVVIVATEEGLARVPKGLRSGSFALGATKAETIRKIILPIASPGIMTGVILAIARAAGEVAPLMLVGAVKFAPNLPIDGEFPYLHLDRQFMHLGVLIYDGAFHSQTDAKSASMMFASCLLLLVVVFVLNVTAVILRTRLRKRYLQG